MRYAMVVLVFLVASCCSCSREEKKTNSRPTLNLLTPPPPVAAPPEVEPVAEPVVDRDPKVKFAIFYLLDQSNKFSNMDRLQIVDLTLSEAMLLGIPADVWFFCFTHDFVGPAPIFLVCRSRS